MNKLFKIIQEKERRERFLDICIFFFHVFLYFFLFCRAEFRPELGLHCTHANFGINSRCFFFYFFLLFCENKVNWTRSRDAIINKKNKKRNKSQIKTK